MAWILGGATFALVPFDSLVKGGAVVALPESSPLPGDWVDSLAIALTDVDSPHEVITVASSQGALAGLTRPEGTTWVSLENGQLASRPDSGQISTYAKKLYAGEGVLTSARFVAQTEARYFGLVDELYGRTGVWQASFSDFQNTRLYFDGDTGRYLTVRNDFWVFYDAMWRLHIMDYRGGEDFNNLLLRSTVLLTLGFLLSGLVLMSYSIRRYLRSHKAS